MRNATIVATLLLSLSGAAISTTITTDAGHFRVHYADGARETARQVAVIAEEAFYQLVTAFDLHEEFRPIDILVTDNLDLANGYADYYQNQVGIYATNLNMQLRGTHNWLRNVVVHELGHIFSMKLARKYPFRYGLIQASVINSDIADFGISIPIYSQVAPSWWVEGVAQYESEEHGGESWDTHRDMLLRAATLENDLLSYDDMGVFAHNWIKSEMVYNQGYALTRFIGDRFGRDKPRELAANTGYVTFSTATNQTIGLWGEDLYDQWRTHIRKHYDEELRRVGAQVEGTAISDEGTYAWSPAISPDGRFVAYVSNGREDYMLTKPRILDLASGDEEEIDERMFGRVAWFPDGSRVVYTKFGRGTLFLDLYVYDLGTNEERRISSRLRARDPAVSPDGEWIAFVSNEDGGNRLGTIRSDGSEVRWLTNDRRSASARESSLA